MDKKILDIIAALDDDTKKKFIQHLAPHERLYISHAWETEYGYKEALTYYLDEDDIIAAKKTVSREELFQHIVDLYTQDHLHDLYDIRRTELYKKLFVSERIMIEALYNNKDIVEEYEKAYDESQRNNLV